MLSAVLIGPLALAQTIDPLSADDLDALADRLRSRVAEIHVHVEVPEDLPLLNEEEIVYGIPVDERHVVCVAQLLERARQIWVHGPEGRARAKVVLDDRERRVAILEVESSLGALGLVPSAPLPRDARERDQPVFALIATTGEGTTLSGVITDPGLLIQNDGHPTTTLKLTRGMPVFDVELRWVGVSRALAWDPNPSLLIPPELVEAARKDAAPDRDAEAAPARPWWAKDL